MNDACTTFSRMNSAMEVEEEQEVLEGRESEKKKE
jgi:hypothetical protein